MSLKGVLKQKLLGHYCGNKCAGPSQSHYMICQTERHRLLEKCYIHKTLLFLPHHGGVRLMSFSLGKFNILSRLTSYFTQKKKTKVEPSEAMPADLDYEGESSQGNTQDEQYVRSVLSNHKFMSLINKLPISSLYSMTLPVNSALKKHPHEEREIEVRKQFQENLSKSAETFLQQYNRDLDIILKKSTPPPSARKSKHKVQSMHNETKAEDKTILFKNIKYPVVKITKTTAIRTPHFEETKQFLQSLGIPCDELEYFPGVQEMSKDEVLTCINALKERDIHVVFALFLIDRVALELNIQKDEEKQSRKLPITSFRQVKVYLELCQLLNIPDLDIRNLLEQLAEIGQYVDISVIHRKVKKLLELGATPNDILSNLEILHGYEIFYKKVELYKKSMDIGQGPFPVHLFLAKNMAIFKDKLALGDELDELIKLLDVSIIEFQSCWGFKYNKRSKLIYKVQMCLGAGISQKDIFNNLGALMGLTVEQCHTVTSCFRESGLPASVFLLRQMASATKLKGNSDGNNIDQSLTDMCSNATVEDDWMVDGKTLFPPNITPTVPPKNHQTSTSRNVISTKKQRNGVFSIIKYLLDLDSAMACWMYKCHVNVSAVERLDVSKNMDYLISQNFTKYHISMCPLILAHPHSALVRVVKEASTLTRRQFLSASSLSAPDSFDEHSGQLSASSSGSVVVLYNLKQKLYASPLKRLNAFQYFLEKDNCFSLACTDDE